ncbi:hypothetical protein H5410_041694 [Solanum commersonii]|uniref:Ubiquitin-like protease family profile domain-containing protein n=1 Tax=Solanum commersonii TaxID=4109 RepID=A0A9J5XVA8_SOLCO|nr:hypothetical protein H5410_041694 [Solanum commersonii]
MCQNRLNQRLQKTPKKRRRKAVPTISRPALPRSMKYVIKKVPTHAIRFGVPFNTNFLEEFQKSIGDDVIDLFRATIFGPYLNIPKCNFQGQISKCLLLLELEQGNSNVLHIRHANGVILKFGIKEFAIITGLKCKGNTKEFEYPESTPCRLFQKYFPGAVKSVSKNHLVQRFLMGNWENNQDALQMAILYFLHTFILAQTDGPSTPATNVHGSADAQKVNYVISDIEELKDHLKNYVDKKFEELVILIKENHSQLMLSRHKENNKVDPQSSNKQPFSPIRTDSADAVGVADFEVGVSVNEGGQQVHVNAEIDHNISNRQQMKRVSELQLTYESTHVDTEANDPKKVSDDEAYQSPQALNEVNIDGDGADTVQHNIRHFTPFRITVDTSDSSTSTTISPSTEAAIDALVSDLGKVPIHAKPLCVYNLQDLNGSHDLLSNSQLPTDIPTTEIVVRSHSKTPAPRNRVPSRIIQSPYVTSFGSSDKEKQKLDDDVRLYFPFEGCGITYQPSSKLIDEYIQWLTKGLLKNHVNKKSLEDKYRSKASSFEFEMMDFVVAFPINKNWFYAMSQPNKCWTDQHIDVIFYYLRKKSKLRSMNQYRYTTANCLFISHIKNTYERYYLANDDDLISTQEHIDRASAVSVYERSITNFIKGFEIPVALPWHLVDDVYIPVNCGGQFHWVLAVVELKNRVIRVYDSSLGSRKKAIPHEIKMLSKMLPSYLMDSGFFEKTERTSFVDCDAYKDNNSGSLLEAQVPFMVEFAQDIMQQKSDSLDCGLYVAIFVEYLSDQIETSFVDFLPEYLRKRYGALLWSYGSEKAKGAYVSESDDPPKPKSVVIQPPEEDLVHVV